MVQNHITNCYLEPLLLVLLLLPGALSIFTRISSTKMYMFVGDNPLNFFESWRFCADNYNTTLAKIHNELQNSDMYSLVQTDSNDPVWIAASDVFAGENAWRWLESMGPIALSEMNFTKWNQTQPDNANNEDCAVMLITDNNDHWADADCNDVAHNFVCYAPDYTAMPSAAPSFSPSQTPSSSPSQIPTPSPVQPDGFGPYKFYWSENFNYVWINHTANWFEASFICQQEPYGTNIASIHSAEDNTEAFNICRDKNCWIGGTDVPIHTYGWQWNDATAFDYSNWVDTEPSITYSSGIKYNSGSSQWVEADADDTHLTILCNGFPTPPPTSAPSGAPSEQPTETPTMAPTEAPTDAPSETPTKAPTMAPTEAPTDAPSEQPTETPTMAPTEAPTDAPSETPTAAPTMAPTEAPTDAPSETPTKAPSSAPTELPTNAPTISPTIAPSAAPTLLPTAAPSLSPSKIPTNAPSIPPTNAPSLAPTQPPTNAPSSTPTNAPSLTPTKIPTNAPTSTPTDAPSLSPSKTPTAAPTITPTNTPTHSPTKTPSSAPTQPPTIAPSDSPTKIPSSAPSQPPSITPSASPSQPPSIAPTELPTSAPSNAPTTSPIAAPTVTTFHPSMSPSAAPSIVTLSPSYSPTFAPTDAPTAYATSCGTRKKCYYQDVIPEWTNTVSLPITIQDTYPGAYESYYDIYITAKSYPCYNPKLSFRYERIDNDISESAEYIVIEYGSSYSKKCGGVSNSCNSYATCLTAVSFGLSTISVNQQIKLEITRQSRIQAFCSNNIAINAILTLRCDASRITTDAPTSTTLPPTSTPTEAPSTTLPPTSTPTEAPSENTVSPTSTTSSPTHGTLSPSAEPSSSPTIASSAPTLSPTVRVLCGSYTYCYYRDIYPEVSTVTSTTINITSTDDNRATYFDIIFTAIDNTCYNPAISLEYEQIDISGDTEYVDVFDNDTSLIKRCQGNNGYDTQCGVFWECLHYVSLGVSQIDIGSSYTVRISDTSASDAFCSHPWSINANLTLTCGGTYSPTIDPTTGSPTINPTIFPTKEPTTATVSPTNMPTQSPSALTSAPTSAPTERCGSYTYCYHRDIYPISNTMTMFTVNITTIDDSADTLFHVTYRPIGAACYNPSISFTYEQIDVGGSNEYIDIYDNDHLSIQCQGNGISDSQCGVFWTCLSHRSLGIAQIDAGSNYTLHLLESSATDDLCSHQWSTNANLTLICGATSAEPTTSPTRHPSASTTSTEPTTSPTRSPSAGTLLPTLSPTVRVSCGSYTYCYYRDIYPEVSTVTSTTINITSTDDNRDTYFDIIFTAIDNICYNPAISLEYEQIDISSDSEYVDVYDNDTSLIKRCQGNNGYDTQCGVFWECLHYVSLGVSQIDIGSSYTVRISDSSASDAFCSHSWSINANLTLTCGATYSPTMDPTTGSPTINPTMFPTEQPTTTQPTLTPSVATLSPTPNPTVALCDGTSDHWCYYKDITLTTTSMITSFDVQITNTPYNFGSYYDIYFTPLDYSCIDPSISVTFERIDYDSSSEYIGVYFNDYAVATCGAGVSNRCGVNYQCLNTYTTGNAKINVGEQYKVTLYESSNVHALCSHSFSINATVTLYCNNYQTATPTTHPTAEPTASPTVTTYLPTKAPTKIPTITTISPTKTPTTTSYAPSSRPTFYPTYATNNPSSKPTSNPTNKPTRSPLATGDTHPPSQSPTTHPTYSEMRCGSTISGSVWDVDYYTMILDAFAYSIKMRTCNSEFYIDLYDENYEPMYTNSTSCSNKKPVYHFKNLESGEYVIGIGAFEGSGGYYEVDIICATEAIQTTAAETTVAETTELVTTVTDSESDEYDVCQESNVFCEDIFIELDDIKDGALDFMIYSTSVYASMHDIYLFWPSAFDGDRRRLSSDASCSEPTLSLAYEAIDNNNRWQNLVVFLNDADESIQNCYDRYYSEECEYVDCLEDYSLNSLDIDDISEIYRIRIIKGSPTRANCDDEYTMKVQVSFNCNPSGKLLIPQSGSSDNGLLILVYFCVTFTVLVFIWAFSYFISQTKNTLKHRKKGKLKDVLRGSSKMNYISYISTIYDTVTDFMLSSDIMTSAAASPNPALWRGLGSLSILSSVFGAVLFAVKIKILFQLYPQILRWRTARNDIQDEMRALIKTQHKHLKTPKVNTQHLKLWYETKKKNKSIKRYLAHITMYDLFTPALENSLQCIILFYIRYDALTNSSNSNIWDFLMWLKVTTSLFFMCWGVAKAFGISWGFQQDSLDITLKPHNADDDEMDKNVNPFRLVTANPQLNMPMIPQPQMQYMTAQPPNVVKPSGVFVGRNPQQAEIEGHVVETTGLIEEEVNDDNDDDSDGTNVSQSSLKVHLESLPPQRNKVDPFKALEYALNQEAMRANAPVVQPMHVEMTNVTNVTNVFAGEHQEEDNQKKEDEESMLDVEIILNEEQEREDMTVDSVNGDDEDDIDASAADIEEVKSDTESIHTEHKKSISSVENADDLLSNESEIIQDGSPMDKDQIDEMNPNQDSKNENEMIPMNQENEANVAPDIQAINSDTESANEDALMSNDTASTDKDQNEEMDANESQPEDSKHNIEQNENEMIHMNQENETNVENDVQAIKTDTESADVDALLPNDSGMMDDDAASTEKDQSDEMHTKWEVLDEDDVKRNENEDEAEDEKDAPSMNVVQTDENDIESDKLKSNHDDNDTDIKHDDSIKNEEAELDESDDDLTKLSDISHISRDISDILKQYEDVYDENDNDDGKEQDMKYNVDEDDDEHEDDTDMKHKDEKEQSVEQKEVFQLIDKSENIIDIMTALVNNTENEMNDLNSNDEEIESKQSIEMKSSDHVYDDEYVASSHSRKISEIIKHAQSQGDIYDILSQMLSPQMAANSSSASETNQVSSSSDASSSDSELP